MLDPRRGVNAAKEPALLVTARYRLGLLGVDREPRSHDSYFVVGPTLARPAREAVEDDANVGGEEEHVVDFGRPGAEEPVEAAHLRDGTRISVEDEPHKTCPRDRGALRASL